MATLNGRSVSETEKEHLKNHLFFKPFIVHLPAGPPICLEVWEEEKKKEKTPETKQLLHKCAKLAARVGKSLGFRNGTRSRLAFCKLSCKLLLSE